MLVSSLNQKRKPNKPFNSPCRRNFNSRDFKFSYALGHSLDAVAKLNVELARILQHWGARKGVDLGFESL